MTVTSWLVGNFRNFLRTSVKLSNRKVTGALQLGLLDTLRNQARFSCLIYSSRTAQRARGATLARSSLPLLRLPGSTMITFFEACSASSLELLANV